MTIAKATELVYAIDAVVHPIAQIDIAYEKEGVKKFTRITVKRLRPRNPILVEVVLEDGTEVVAYDILVAIA